MPVARHLLRPTRELGRATLKRSPIWSCTGWGLPSFPGHPENWCALTAPFHPCRAYLRGGLLSVALSFALPRLHVMEHPALWCSDFPPDLELNPAIVWSTPAGRRTLDTCAMRYSSGFIPVQNSITEGAQFQAVKPLQLIVGLGRDIHVAAHTD